MLCTDPNNGPWELVRIISGQGTASLGITRAIESYNGDQTAKAWPSGTYIAAVITHDSLQLAGGTQGYTVHEEFLPTNGATTVTLSTNPAQGIGVVSRNGVVQSTTDGHYTQAGVTLTFSTAFTGTERVVVSYTVGTTGAQGPPGASGFTTWPAGTVSAPGWAVTGDLNTGLYQPAADQVAISTGGVLSLWATATGVEVEGTLVAGGTVGFGSNATNTAGLLVSYGGAWSTSSQQYGVMSQMVFSTFASSGYAVYGRGGSQNAAWTLTSSYAFYADTAYVGSGSAITTSYGFYVRNQGAAGIANVYGVYIAAQSGATTTNIGLYNAGTTTLLGTLSINTPGGTQQISLSGSTATASLMVSTGIPNPALTLTFMGSTFFNVFGSGGAGTELQPGTDNLFDLGDSSHRWRTLYAMTPVFSGNLSFTPDNSNDIGASASGRPRNVYAGTSFVGPLTDQTTPAYSFVGNPTTGIFCDSFPEIGVTISGTTQLWVFGGSTGGVQVTKTMSVAGSIGPDATINLQLASTLPNASTEYGLRSATTTNASGSAYGVYAAVANNRAGGASNAYTFYAAWPSVTATTTNVYGLYVENLGGVNRTNAYGVYILVQSGAATTNIGLYNGGTTRLLGNIGAGSGGTIRTNTAFYLWQDFTSISPTSVVLMDVEGQSSPSGGSSTAYGLYVAPQIYYAGATTLYQNYGIYVAANNTVNTTTTWGYGLYVRDQSYGTVTHAYGIYVENMQNGVVETYSIYAGGPVRFDGPLGIGVQQPWGNTMLNVSPPSGYLSGVNQYGVSSTPTFTSGATTSGTAIQARVILVAAAFTMASGYGLFVASPSLGAGSAVTNSYGINIQNQGASGVANAYGVYINTQSGATNTNYGLYVGGFSYFAGNVGINSAPNLATLLNAQGNLSGGATEIGMYFHPYFDSAATAQGCGYACQLGTQSGSYSLGTLTGFYLDGPIFNHTGTINQINGIRINNQGTSQVTTAYGLSVDAQAGATSTNVAIIITNATAGRLVFNDPNHALTSGTQNFMVFQEYGGDWQWKSGLASGPTQQMRLTSVSNNPILSLGTGTNERIRLPANSQANLAVESMDGYVMVSSALGSHIAYNTYWDGTNWVNMNTANPYSLFIVSGGNFQWYTAPAGASTSVPWTSTMSLSPTVLTVTANVVATCFSTTGKNQTAGQVYGNYVISDTGMDIGSGPLYFAHNGGININWNGSTLKTPNHFTAYYLHTSDGSNGIIYSDNGAIYLRAQNAICYIQDYNGGVASVYVNTMITNSGITIAGAGLGSTTVGGQLALMASSGNGDFVLGGGASSVYMHPNFTVGIKQSYPQFNVFGFTGILCNGINTNSSRRYKRDIQVIPDALGMVMDPEVAGTHFLYNPPQAVETDVPKFGLIAEPWQRIAPDLVTLDEDGEPSSMDYQQVTAILFQAFREYVGRTDAKIAELEAKLAA